jgi:hypothetical protein
MATRGWLGRCEVIPGKDAEAEAFLASAVRAISAERGTTGGLAIRFGRSECSIFDVFPDHFGFAHLTGHVARELAKHALTLLGSLPDPDLQNVIASQLDAH